MVRLLLSSIIVLIGLTFIGRLSFLQLFNVSADQIMEDPAIEKVHIYPERGHIYDRNYELLVGNQPAFDVMVIPRDVRPLDTLAFCELLDIDKPDFERRLARARTFNPKAASVFLAQLSREDYAVLQEKMRRFPGFYIQKKPLRFYNTPSAANVLGYITEVNPEDVRTGDFIQGEMKGRTGVEKQYDRLLRGKKGIQFIQKDRFNSVIGPYQEGNRDTAAVKGHDIQITIDKALQEYGETLMHGKRGGIVALEPSSGEILAMISGPTYNPDLLVGRYRSRNYTELYYDSIAKPTWDRSILAQPSPGSPFKTLIALSALQRGVIDEDTQFRCFGGFYVGDTKRGCHCGGGVRQLHNGIYRSCNAYFAGTFRKYYGSFGSTDEAHDEWTRTIKSFGLGDYLGTDIPTGAPGRVPNTAYYDRAYGDDRWGPTYIISNAIGQGEVAATPVQLANMTAAIANRGHYYTPHLIRKTYDNNPIDPRFSDRHETEIDREHFEPVIAGMAAVYDKGTAWHLKIPGVDIAGKTGTVENFTLIDGVRYQLTDHSVFVAFAPVENPKIALAVYIEHGYYGGRYAGHIASLMIEKYLKGDITRKDLEKRMLEKTLEHEYAKPFSCEPFEINEYVW